MENLSRSELAISPNSSRVIFDLGRILREAPLEVEYRPHNNGFHLSNDAIRIEYTVISAFSRNNLGLWFLQTSPKAGVSGENINMTKLPRSIICNYLSLHTGDTHEFHDLNTIDIHKDPSPWHDKIGPKEYFKRGTDLLKEASRKYNLKRWYQHYTGKADRPEIRSLQPNFRTKLVGLLPF